jgi:hypothetical protein
VCALAALLCALPCAVPRADSSAPPVTNTTSSIGARYPLDAARFVSRFPEPTQDIPPTLEQLNKRTPYDFDPQQGLPVDGFTLWTVDDLGNPLPELQQYVKLHGRDLVHGDYHLSIQITNAPPLTDFYCYVRYRQERWTAISCQPGSAFGLKGDRLWMTRLDMPGLVPIGLSRVRPDFNGGIKLQDGVIAEVVFTERPFQGKATLFDHAPNGAENKPQHFSAYVEPPTVRGPNSDLGPDNPKGCAVTLYWEEANRGDTNNDGEVGLGDLTPIARRYGHLSTDGSEDEWDRLPDANHDGEVNYRDAFVIESHFGSLLSGYRVYRRPAGTPAGGKDEALLPDPLGRLLPLSIHRPVEWNPIAKGEYRYTDLSLPYSPDTRHWLYRIVPYDARDNAEGVGSQIEVELAVSPDKVEVVRNGDVSPAAMRDVRVDPKTDNSGRETKDHRVQRGSW